MSDSSPKAVTQELRSMVQDVAELKAHLKSQSKNQLIQNIMNLVHNQLGLLDIIDQLKQEMKKEEANAETAT